MLEIQNLTLAGLFAIGVVNVVSFYFKDMDSKMKFAISFVAAFLALLVPANLGNMIANFAKEAISIAFIASGTYKLSQKVGGE